MGVGEAGAPSQGPLEIVPQRLPQSKTEARRHDLRTPPARHSKTVQEGVSSGDPSGLLTYIRGPGCKQRSTSASWINGSRRHRVRTVAGLRLTVVLLTCTEDGRPRRTSRRDDDREEKIRREYAHAANEPCEVQSRRRPSRIVRSGRIGRTGDT